jgi:hypothetical protein
MRNPSQSTLHRLLECCCTTEEADALIKTVSVPPPLLHMSGDSVSRALLCQALMLVLLRDLLARTPTARRYVEGRVSQGQQIVFDHGAVRTVALAGMGALPAGESAITRVLHPLGYVRSETYPLDRLGMTGRAYTHQDFPESLPQFFLSELHPERFSGRFQEAVRRITASSRDPLPRRAQQQLATLSSCQVLDMSEARSLLADMTASFARQHDAPALSDYNVLLKESAEAAWIATEGNTFNHATDRVPSLEELITEQRRLERPLKDKIETSRSGRVRQTAFRADSVEREFVGRYGGRILCIVPGSFFEFIQRERLVDRETGGWRLDLSFDSSNAQGIFGMTAASR